MIRTFTHAGTSALARVFVVLAILSWTLAGCRQPDDNPGISYWGDDGDLEFQAGANRPPTFKTLYAMAKILAAQGKDNECQFVLIRIIREHPGFMPAYCDLAELQMRHGRNGEAINTLNAGLKVSSRDAVLLNNLGMCWLLEADYDKALEKFTKAVASVPHDIRYRSNLAVALGMMGRYEESLSLFKQILPLPDAHHNLAVICEARRDYARSLQEYKKAAVLGG